MSENKKEKEKKKSRLHIHGKPRCDLDLDANTGNTHFTHGQKEKKWRFWERGPCTKDFKTSAHLGKKKHIGQRHVSQRTKAKVNALEKANITRRMIP